jgi:hypothetical protein
VPRNSKTPRILEDVAYPAFLISFCSSSYSKVSRVLSVFLVHIMESVY